MRHRIEIVWLKIGFSILHILRKYSICSSEPSTNRLEVCADKLLVCEQYVVARAVVYLWHVSRHRVKIVRLNNSFVSFTTMKKLFSEHKVWSDKHRCERTKHACCFVNSALLRELYWVWNMSHVPWSKLYGARNPGMRSGMSYLGQHPVQTISPTARA